MPLVLTFPDGAGVKVAGTSVGVQPGLNFVAGTNVTITGTNNTANNRVDITVNSTATSTGGAAVTVPRHIQSFAALRAAAQVANLVLRHPVGSGDILLVLMGWFQGANTASSVSDNLSTPYTKITEITGSTHNIAIFVGKTTTTGTCTITPAYPVGGSFSGLYASDFDGTTLTTNTDAGTSTSGSGSPVLKLTSTNTGVLVWGGCDGDSNTTVWGVPAGFLMDGATNGADAGAIYHTIQPSPGGIYVSPFG